MPRTKVSRKIMQKRNRRSSTEEKMEMKLRNFDTMAEDYVSNLEDEYNAKMTEITDMINKIKQKIPMNIQKMKLKDIREKEFHTISEMTVVSGREGNLTLASEISTIASLSLIGEKMRQKDHCSKKRSHQDEEEGSQSNRSSGVGSYMSSQSSTSSRKLGPLASAKAKLRRSKSVGQINTPSVKTSANLVATKASKGTPLANALMSTHASRSKYKTPLMNRTKAISADRLIITPKVQPNTPMAILRRANAGETVFSVTGSPVISSSGVENVANVNIPVSNGILSIRPTQMTYADAQVVNKFDYATIEQLKMLQQNLNKIMQAAERNNFKSNA